MNNTKIAKIECKTTNVKVTLYESQSKVTEIDIIIRSKIVWWYLFAFDVSVRCINTQPTIQPISNQFESKTASITTTPWFQLASFLATFLGTESFLATRYKRIMTASSKFWLYTLYKTTVIWMAIYCHIWTR